MPISKQLTLVSKPDAYTATFQGPSSQASYSSLVPNHLNGYFESNVDSTELSRKTAFVKRPGCVDTGYVSLFSNLALSATERVKGLTTSLDKTWTVFATELGANRYVRAYYATTNSMNTTNITASTTAGREWAFTQLDNINYGTNVAYAATNGAEGMLLTSAGIPTVISDVDYTGLGTKTCFVGLDGYLFFGVISGTGQGRIYNSDLSSAAAATGWTATSYLSALDIPGAIVWLARIRNFIICFKQGSIEFFENVGNPTPGSPLEPRKGLTKNIGCASASSVQYVHDGIIFLGIDKNGKQGFYKINSTDLSVKPISNAIIEMCLHNGRVSVANFQQYSNDYESASNNARAQSQVVIWHNKEIYLTTLYSYLDAYEITMAYDNELDLWYQWATNFGGAGDGTLIDRHFIPSMCFQLTAGSSGGYYTMFVNNYASMTTSRFSVFYTPYTGGTVASNCWKDSYSITTSEFNNYPCAWRSEHFDFGTNDRKFWNSLEVIFDSPAFSGDTTATGIMLVRIQRLSGRSANLTNTQRTIYPAINTVNRVKLNRLGQFRAAAIEILAYGPFPTRMWAVEVVYSNGPQYS